MEKALDCKRLSLELIQSFDPKYPEEKLPHRNEVKKYIAKIFESQSYLVTSLHFLGDEEVIFTYTDFSWSK